MLSSTKPIFEMTSMGMDTLAHSSLLVLDHYLRPRDRSRRLLHKRIAMTERLHARAPFTEVLEPVELPALQASEASPEAFARASARKTRPVVIRGLMKSARSVMQWSPDYFREVCGDDEYPMLADARKHDPITKQHDFEFVSIRELLDELERGEGFRYVNNLTRIFADHPELIDDLELPRLAKLIGQETDDCFQLVNLFMGGANTSTSMHCAFAGNFFNNIVGRKEWLFINPRYTKYLLPMPSRPFIYMDAFFDPGDPDKADFARKLPSYRVVLEPGDVLYSAPWWWHRVNNLTPFSIGCAVRHSSLRADFANLPLCTLMSQSPKLNLLYKLFRARDRLLGRGKPFRDFLLAELDKEIYEGITRRPSAN